MNKWHGMACEYLLLVASKCNTYLALIFSDLEKMEEQMIYFVEICCDVKRIGMRYRVSRLRGKTFVYHGRTKYGIEIAVRKQFTRRDE